MGLRVRVRSRSVARHAAQLVARVGPGAEHEGIDEVPLRWQVDLLRGRGRGRRVLRVLTRGAEPYPYS